MANETYLANLIDPQVMAEYIRKKLVNDIKFAPLFTIDTTLQGRAGDTVSLPSYEYIGDAQDVAELAAIPYAELNAGFQDVKVKKAGKGVTISDEAMLSAYGNPREEAANQISLSIRSKIDNDCLAVMDNATWISECITVTPNAINDALVLFGEDVEGAKALLVSPATYAVLRQSKDWVPASEIAANITISGRVGMIYGCDVVVSNKITDNQTAYIVKPGAGRIFMKRMELPEVGRDMDHKATKINADVHYVAYLYDPSKIVKLGAATMINLTVTQTSNIASSQASFKVTGYPSNVSAGWKAYYATGLNAAATPSVGDAYSTVASTFDKEYVGDVKYGATNAKYFQVIYVDADNKIRATGSVAAATSIS